MLIQLELIEHLGEPVRGHRGIVEEAHVPIVYSVRQGMYVYINQQFWKAGPSLSRG
jgi:hypothetical protein